MAEEPRSSKSTTATGKTAYRIRRQHSRSSPRHHPIRPTMFFFHATSSHAGLQQNDENTKEKT
jgi:hypothetical protein